MSARHQPLGMVGRLALALVVLLAVMLAIPDPISVLNVLAFAGVGAFVATNRPRNPIGWILVFIAYGFVATSAMPDDIAAVVAGTSSTADFLAAWVGPWAGGLWYLALAALAMLFPSGHLSPGRRWRRVAIGSFALGLVVVGISAVVPTFPFSPDLGVTNYMVRNRFALIPPLDFDSPIPGQVVFTFIPLGVMAVGVGSAVLRYRRAAGVERLQLRWLMASLAFAFTGLVIGLAGFAIVGPQQAAVFWLPAVIAYPTIPLAIGMAVMRYRLFDIDRIISRGLSWAILSGLLVASYAGAIIVLQGLLGGVTQGETVAVAGSTLLAAALFHPLRLRIHSLVDHRFNRARYDAERTAVDFADRLRDEVDVDHLRIALAATAGQAVHPAVIGVWLRPAPGAPR